MKSMQRYHMEEKKFDDIGYNFVVGGDGSVFVGRGWNLIGAHTFGYNAKSIGIGFIGTFSKVAPTKNQLCAAQKLFEEGLRLNKLTSDYSLYGQNQLTGSQSPGEKLYNIIKTWSHWSPRRDQNVF